MESIKKIYRKGYGPSSSHTMAPYRAAVQFRTDHPDAASIRVTLYGISITVHKRLMSPNKACFIYRQIFLAYRHSSLVISQ